MRTALILSSLTVALSACSSQQMYSTGQEWQRNECRKINDTAERQRCLDKANTSQDKYQRDADAAKAGK